MMTQKNAKQIDKLGDFRAIFQQWLTLAGERALYSNCGAIYLPSINPCVRSL